MRKILSFFLIITIMCCCSACKEEKVLDTENLYNETQSNYMMGEHVAYYLVFDKLIKNAPHILENIKYIVVDVNNTCLIDTKYLGELFKNYANENNMTFFMDTKDGLTERNHIINGEYQNGIVITYKDVECLEDRLLIELEIWNSTSKNISKKFVVEKIRGEWKIV